MDALYRYERATAREVRESLPDPPTMNAVRRLLGILEEKDLVDHRWDGPRYVYFPLIEKEKAKQAAILQLVETFFHGSKAEAMATLFEEGNVGLTEDERDALNILIDRARERENSEGEL